MFSLNKITLLIPDKITNRVKTDNGLKKIFFSINWLFIEKVIKLLIDFVIGVWIVRYLGPNKFGNLSYALSFVAIFSNLSNLGLNNVGVRELVKNKKGDKRKEILGSSFLILCLGSIILFILSISTNFFIKPQNDISQTLIPIIAFGYLFKPLEVIDFWFQSQVELKYPALSRLISHLIVAMLKMLVIIIGASIIALSWLYSFELILTSIFLLYYFNINNSELQIFEWRVKLNTVKKLLRDSWPLAISGVGVMLYQKIDNIIISNMLGDFKLGVYSAGTKLSTIWYFLPMIVGQSVLPAIVNAKRKSQKLYLKRLQKLFIFLTWLAIVLSSIISIFSTPIISLLFGKQYMESSTILSIHVWSNLFIFLNIINAKYYLTENLTRVTLISTCLTAIINIMLNLFLIRIWGITGAAWATLISYLFLAYLSNLIFKKGQVIFKMLIKSLNPFYLYREIQNYV